MWKQQIIDLGKVKVKVPINVSFKYLGNGKYVSSKASCGCTIPNWNNSVSMLSVTYTPNKIAEHLKLAGKSEYNSVKYIRVIIVEDGNVINYDLEIKAKVYG